MFASLATALTGAAGLIAFAPQALSLDLPWAPDTAQAQVGLAREALARSDNDEAAKDARRALSAMPYNQAALALLAESRALPDPVNALNLAAAFGWRDTLANVRLVRQALTEGEETIAAQRIDALGRADGAALAGPLADLLMARAEGPQALARRAGHRTGSTWWLLYLRQPSPGDEVERGRLAFARALDKDDGTWLRGAVEAVTASLRGPAASERGYALWRDAVADPAGFGPVLYDEAFRRLPMGKAPLGGEWISRPDAPFAVERAGDRGITLTAIAESAGIVLAQAAPVNEGRYRFAVTGETPEPRLYWRIACGDGNAVLRSGSAIGTWQVDIPAGCSTAVFELWADKGATGSRPALVGHAALEPLR